MYKQTFKNENCELYKKLLINIRSCYTISQIEMVLQVFTNRSHDEKSTKPISQTLMQHIQRIQRSVQIKEQKVDRFWKFHYSRCSFSVLLGWANAIKVWANAIKIPDQHKCQKKEILILSFWYMCYKSLGFNPSYSSYSNK